MIYLYTGTPGSGKSLNSARVIVRWITRLKSPVIGNFEFKANAIRNRGWGSYLYCPNDKLTPDFLIAFSELYKKKRKWNRVPEEEILLVIDECQLIFNAREWNKPNRKEWNSFFTQHRKLGYHIILICQNKGMLDKQVRALVEYEVLHRKIKNIGKFGYFMNLLAMGGLHVMIKIYAPLNMKTESQFFRSDKRLYALYDSYTRF